MAHPTPVPAAKPPKVNPPTRVPVPTRTAVPTATPRSTMTPEEIAQRQFEIAQAEKAFKTPTATATPKPEATSKPTTFTAAERREGWISQAAADNGVTVAEFKKGLTGPQSQALDAAVASGELPPSMQQGLDSRNQKETNAHPGPMGWDELQSIDKIQDPFGIAPEDVQRIEAQDQQAGQSGLTPRTGGQRSSTPTASRPAPQQPQGYSHSWQNPSGQDYANPLGAPDPNTYSANPIINAGMWHGTAGGGGGVATGPSHNWAYYDPNRGSADQTGYADASMPGYRWDGQNIVPGFRAGGRLIVSRPATLHDDATGRPLAKIGEQRPEELFSHPDGSIGIDNHVPGLGRPDFSPETYPSPYHLDNPATPNDALPTAGQGAGIMGQTWGPYQWGVPMDVQIGDGGQDAMPVNNAMQDTLDHDFPRLNPTPRHYAGGGTIDPNNPDVNGVPPIGPNPSSDTTAGFTGTSFPGTNIGGTQLQGLNAGPIPSTNLPWNGQGNIPQGLDVNQLENQSNQALFGLQNYRNQFNTNLQNTYAGINNARQGFLGQEAEAEKLNPQRMAMQHARDTYDYGYGKGGMKTPTEVNPAVGDFGLPTGSPGGIGLRYALLSPEQSYNRVNQPLSEYESLVGKTAAGVQAQIADNEARAKILISALHGENPSKANPNGPGLVSSNFKELGQGLTPQQQEDDNAALLRAQESLASGQIGTLTLPSGLKVTYSGRKSTSGGGSSGGGGSSSSGGSSSGLIPSPPGATPTPPAPRYYNTNPNQNGTFGGRQTVQATPVYDNQQHLIGWRFPPVPKDWQLG